MTCKFCRRHLYPNNRSGRCNAHRRWVDAATCKIQGCGKRLRKDCETGYCREHREFSSERSARKKCDRDRAALAALAEAKKFIKPNQTALRLKALAEAKSTQAAYGIQRIAYQ